MTTLEKCLAGTALAVAIGVFVAASSVDDQGAAPGAAAATATTTPTTTAVALGADGAPLEPTEGMLESEWRLIVWRRVAAAARATGGLAGAADRDPGRQEGGEPGEDLLDSAELAAADPQAFEEVVGSLDAGRDERLDLLGQCNRRRQTLRSATASDTPLDLELSIVSAGGVGRIVAVNAAWPADVDAEGIACYQRAYVGHEFATDHDYAYRYRWSICSPGPGARDDGEHPAIPAIMVREL